MQREKRRGKACRERLKRRGRGRENGLQEGAGFGPGKGARRWKISSLGQGREERRSWERRGRGSRQEGQGGERSQ